MKCIVQELYGSTDVLTLGERPEPVPRAGQVLIQVRAAGVDPGVWHQMTGLPYAMRLAGYGLRRPRNPTVGMDVAGTVTAIGPGVTRFQPGQAVFGTAAGTFAEYVCAAENQVVAKPAGTSFEQAAAVPVSANTALQGLRDRGKLQSGQKVLIIGASGGVGSYAVQLATSFGAHVTGACSTKNAELVRSLGADDVIDYTRETVTTARGAHRYDLIFDLVSTEPVRQLRQALTPSGTLVFGGGEGPGRWVGDATRQLWAPLSLFSRQKLRGLLSLPNLENLQLLSEMLESGTITPAINRTFPLAEAGAAIDFLRQCHPGGKLVLTV